MSAPVYIIAEAGVNHNGQLGLARQLVEAAANAGADAVKFQTFKASELATAKVAKAAYQQRTTGGTQSQLEMLRTLELGHEAHFELKRYAEELGIDFLSTAFDEKSLGFLVDRLGLCTLKIPSGEITNGPFLLAHARTGLPVILSTGMATLVEVEAALSVLAYGYVHSEAPRSSAFSDILASESAWERLREKVTLLHCTTEYPAPPDQLNLNAIKTMADRFGLRVGYSDHSEGIDATVAAVAMGAQVVEKHFTLDRTMEGPDHKASLEPEALSAMVKAVRRTERMLGTGDKRPQPDERKNMAIARKVIVAACAIRQGQPLSAENLAFKRAGDGRSPMDFWDLLGTAADRDYEQDEVIA